MIQDATDYGIDWVMTHLRPHDERELRATIMTSLSDHAQRLRQVADMAWEAREPAMDLPAAIGGIVPLWPGVCTVWVLGTPHFPNVAVEVTRFVKRSILPSLQEAGFHRAEARALRGNGGTARWLGFLGFREEAVLARFGQGREDFTLFAWTPDEPSTPH